MEANTSNTRRPSIPRPWLSKPRRSLEADYIDLLEKPRWTISWSKLSSCFCIKDQSAKKIRHCDELPFSPFPAMHQHSTCSFSSYGDDDSGSVSSFTDSDTFSYSTEEEAESEQPRPRASTPPPAPISRPPIIAARSRSAGLPPLNPCSSLSTPQPPMNRSRCDTGDNTRTSATTNTSRHRRLEQFQFSPHSMERIWRGSNEKVIPPSFVLCEDVALPDPRNDFGWGSGSVEMFNNHRNYYDWTRQHDNNVEGKGDDESYSPFAQLDRKLIDEAWDEAKPEKLKLVGKQERRGSLKMDNDMCKQHFEYLRKNPNWDAVEGKLILSGWIAVSFGSDSLWSRLRLGSPIMHKDIFYMRIVDRNGQARILLQKGEGCTDHSLLLQNNWLCLSQEISSRVGKCVILRSPDGDIATLLPVLLNDTFFDNGTLVSQGQFSQCQDRLFVGGKGKIYAPDAQHDAATHILFSLDALIKSRGM